MRAFNGPFSFGLLTTLLIMIISQSLWAGKIVRPWRSTTAVVKQGETFEIWYEADGGQSINSVDLRSNYKTVNNLSFTEQNGWWEYDFHSNNGYNKILTVTVPSNVPADRYELILNTSSGQENSTGAVKVIQEFRNEYYIVGTSCAHRYQNKDTDADGDSDDDDKVLILRKISEILRAADIMDVQLFFESGDNIYNPGNIAAYYNSSRYPGRPNRSRHYEYFQGIEELGIWGVHDTMAATFMTAGNHEAPDATANGEPAWELAEFYNDNWGMYYFAFPYGNARYMAVSNGWGGGQYNPRGQAELVRDYIDANLGRGNFITSFMHAKQESSTAIYETINFDLSLVGHNHTDAQLNPRTIPYNGGTSPAMQYVADANRDYNRFEFNLFKINNTTGAYSTPSGSTARVQVIEGSLGSNLQNPSNWVRKIELNYGSSNNGSQASNSATIINRHNFQIDDAKIRFIMPLGGAYAVDNGFIRQAFDGDSFHVVDVAVDVPANSNVTVNIIPGGNPIVTFDTPTNNASIAEGTDLNVTVNATDSDGINNVSLLLDGVPLVRTEGSAPYTWSPAQGDLELQNMAIGTYTLTARATDTEGDVGESSITVNVVDTSTHVSFAKPNVGDVYWEGANLEFDVIATDFDGIDRVWLYKDGVELVRSEGMAPYEWGMAGQNDPELQNMAPGNYTFRAVARDSLGNEGEATINITVYSLSEVPPVHVNFQPSSAPVPSGYMADTSQTYGDRGNGFTYGWESAFDMTRDRGADSDQRLDTLNHLQINGADHYWEIELPNGEYQVSIVGGDPSFDDSFIDFVAEEGTANAVTLASGSNAGLNFISGTQVVTVSDGRLTISNGPLAVNNKICYVDIVSTASQNNPPVISSSAVTEADEDVAYSYTVVASDADGDPLTYIGTTVPAWLTFNTGTGLLSGTPGASDVGSHSCTLQVSDGHVAVEQSFSIVVEATPNLPPTWNGSPLGKPDAEVGVAYNQTLSGDATDPEGDPLTFTKTGGTADWISVAANGSLSGIPAAENVGLNTAVVEVTDGVNAGVVVVVSLSVVAAPDPYGAWKVTHGVTDDNADDDGDGIINVMEFALGGDPNSSVSGQRPVVSRNGSSIDFQFRRNEGSVTYTVEKSTDLVNWVPHAIDPGSVGSDVAVTVPDSEMVSGKLFLRLRVNN